MFIDGAQNERLQAARVGALLLVDDHPVFRAGLMSVLTWPASPRPVLEANDVEEAEDRLASHPNISLILYDWHLPLLGGCRGLQRLRTCAPHVPVVVVSADDDDAIGVAARQLGAIDVISKGSSRTAIRDRLISLLGDALPAIAQYEPAGTDDLAAAPEAAAPTSARQRQVLGLLALGYSNKRIASALGICDSTVRAHMTDIFRSLKVRNRTEAALTAARLGLVSTGDSLH